MERLKLYPLANPSRGELTPAEKTALAPVILQVRRALDQFGQPEIVRIELSRTDALAFSYAFEAAKT
jgi:hypothetical protein